MNAETARRPEPERGADPKARGVALILERIDSLPTLPAVATRLLRLGSSEDADFRQVVALIESDPALTAKILGLCRRADRKRGEEITTVDRAVVHLGFEAVRSAALSVNAYEMLSGAGGLTRETTDGPPGLDKKAFWRRCIAVACAAEGLSAAQGDTAGLPKPTVAFVCGLLHGVGSLALDFVLPQAYARALQTAATTGEDLATVERRLLGVDHHAAGRRLAERWDLPPMLHEVIWLTGLPFESLPETPHRRVVGLVNTAVALARRQHLGWAGDPSHLGAPERLCELIGVEREALDTVESKLHDEVSARAQMLGIESAAGDRLIIESLAQANAELQRTRTIAQRERARADRLAAALDEATRFRGAWAHGMDEACAAIARSAGRTLGAAFVAIAHREAGQSVWTIRRFEVSASSAAALRSVTVESPAPWEPDAPGEADLDSRGLDFAEAVDSACASLRALPLPDSNESLVLLHDGASVATGSIARGVEAALALWAGAVVSATRSDVVRRSLDDAACAGAHASELKERLGALQFAQRGVEFAKLVAIEASRPVGLIRARAEVLQQTLSQQRDLRNVDAIISSAARFEALMAAQTLTVDPPPRTLKQAELAPLLGRAIRESMKRVGSNPKRVSQPRIRLLVDEAVKSALVDAERLAGAVAELVANCLEVPEISLIEVDAHNDPETGRLILCVRDDGPGMTPEALAKAFEPFALPKKNTHRKGLGLVMAQRLVSVAGGRIDLANNQSGKGLAATISLPTSDHPGADAPDQRRGEDRPPRPQA